MTSTGTSLWNHYPHMGHRQQHRFIWIGNVYFCLNLLVVKLQLDLNLTRLKSVRDSNEIVVNVLPIYTYSVPYIHGSKPILLAITHKLCDISYVT